MYNNTISIMGTGYVGLVSGTCLADFGNQVIGVDIDSEKIERLNRGEVPIYEPGLKEVLDRNRDGERILFTTDKEKAIQSSEVIFIAVGTPEKEDGGADLSQVFSVAQDIGNYMDSYRVVVIKSTVPVGTGSKVEEIIQKTLKKRGVDYNFHVVSNPEFLREGKAVHDFTHPDRVVIGTESDKARGILQEVYRGLYLNEVPFVFTNRETAEIIKYASNAFLATKISFINEMANLCEVAGGHVQHVAKAMGMDGRISSKFLHAGPGYGGSCFPKDTKAIVSAAEELGIDLGVVRAGIMANERQKKKMVEKVEERLVDLNGKKLGILGLTFKPETDDMREAPSLVMIPELIKRGATIQAYDPQGMESAQKLLEEWDPSILYCASEYEVMKGADALILITEWNLFRRLNLRRIKESLKQPYFFDLRNVYKREEVEAVGLYYCGVGIPSSPILELASEEVL